MAEREERQQLRDEAATYIREMIISRNVQPESLLRLGPIAEALRMSLTPVREALLLLTQAGWVVQEPNRGFRVARLNRRDVLDSYFVNRTVAGELAARASILIDDARVMSLLELDERIRSAATGRDVDTVQRWNTEMHRRIYSIADAPRLLFFVESASLFVPRHFWGSIPGWFEHNRDGHRKIIDALSIHDPDLSRQAMESHIADAGMLLVRYLDESGSFNEAEPEERPAPDPVAS
jgi:DNA-binding GntR family transcriptional regulator